MIVLSDNVASVPDETIAAWLREQRLPDDGNAIAAARWIASNERCGFDRSDPIGRQFITLCSRRGVDPVREDVTAYVQKGSLTFIVGVQALLDRAHSTGLLTGVETDVTIRPSADGKQARIARAVVRRWVQPTDTLQAEHVRRVADLARALGADAAGLASLCVLPVVEREYRAEANVDEWREGQTSPFWRGKPEHQAQLVALRRALRNSGLVSDPDEDVAGWASSDTPADAPADKPISPPLAPKPSGSPSVDRARAALQAAPSTQPATTTPAPSPPAAPGPAVATVEPPHFTDGPEDWSAKVQAAAKKHGLTRADLEAFCQRWRGASLDTLSDADRNTLVTRVLAGARIATADEAARVEALRARLGAGFDSAYTAAGGSLPYGPAHLMGAVATKLLATSTAMSAAMPAAMSMSEAEREDVHSLAAAFRDQGWHGTWRQILDEHSVLDEGSMTSAQAAAVMSAGHAAWERESAAQAKAAASGGWAR